MVVTIVLPLAVEEMEEEDAPLNNKQIHHRDALNTSSGDYVVMVGVKESIAPKIILVPIREG